MNAELRRLFDQFDADNDGKISPSELRSVIGIAGEELSTEDALEMMQLIDTDGDGLLSFDEFVELVEFGDEDGEEELRKNLREAFRAYETEGEGCITPKSLRSALEWLGQSKTIEECERMVRAYDVDGDGVISFDEFRIMML